MAAGSELIQKAARERLRPMGLFQRGSSRRGWNVRDAWNGGMLRYLSGDLAAGDIWTPSWSGSPGTAVPAGRRSCGSWRRRPGPCRTEGRL